MVWYEMVMSACIYVRNRGVGYIRKREGTAIARKHIVNFYLHWALWCNLKFGEEQNIHFSCNRNNGKMYRQTKPSYFMYVYVG